MTPILLGAGLTPLVVPTVTLGHHPGHGSPGGGPIPADMLASQLERLSTHPRGQTPDLIISGYFVHADQVAVFQDWLAHRRGEATYICDPVMGDEAPGLYVGEPTAEALAGLAEHADWVTPNLWEARYLTGVIREPKEVAAALLAMGVGNAMVTSLPGPDEALGIGMFGGVEDIAFGPYRAGAPNGVGDCAAALLAVQWAHGKRPSPAPIVAALQSAISAAQDGELSPPQLVRLGQHVAEEITQ